LSLDTHGSPGLSPFDARDDGGIEALCGVRLGLGTLYGALARLERRGLIEPLPSEDRRRPYRLTAAGTSVLEERLRDLEGFVRAGLGRLATT
jgi:DNA-binding PadR family transcriptional regulator